MLNVLCVLAVLVAVVHAYTYSPAPGGGWESISSSSDGKYIYSADVNGQYGIILSSNYGSSWSSPGNGLMGIWYKIRTSGSGQYVAGIHNNNVDFSSNYGASYKGTVTSVYDVALSRSGQYIIAPVFNGNGVAAIKVSSNHGTSFREVSNTAIANYRVAGMSGSGQYMIASNYTENYFSSDYGSTFAPMKNLPYDYWGPFKFNYDGQYMLFSSGHGDYFSTDYGNTFTPSTFPKGITTFSDSGAFIVVAQPNVGIQISRDYGKTWALSSAPAKNWGDVTVSSDGQRIVACEYRGSIYMSSDYGNTWAQKPSA